MMIMTNTTSKLPNKDDILSITTPEQLINAVVTEGGVNVSAFREYTKDQPESDKAKKTSHAFTMFEEIEAIDITPFSSLGKKESEMLASPQEINYNKVGSIGDVGLYEAKPSDNPKLISGKTIPSTKKLIKIFNQIVNHPDKVNITRNGATIIVTINNKLGGKKNYDLTDILKHVDWTQIHSTDLKLNNAINFILNQTTLFHPTPDLEHATLDFAEKIGKKTADRNDWEDYFRPLIEDKKIKVNNSSLAHQLAINAYTTGLYQGMNSLLRDGGICYLLDNKNNYEGYKTFDVNTIKETLIISILTINAITEYKETYKKGAVRGESNMSKLNEFEDKGVLSLANGKSDFLSNEFLKKVNEATANKSPEKLRENAENAVAILCQHVDKKDSFTLDEYIRYVSLLKKQAQMKSNTSNWRTLSTNEKDLINKIENAVTSISSKISKMTNDDEKTELMKNMKVLTQYSSTITAIDEQQKQAQNRGVISGQRNNVEIMLNQANQIMKNAILLDEKIASELKNQNINNRKELLALRMECISMKNELLDLKEQLSKLIDSASPTKNNEMNNTQLAQIEEKSKKIIELAKAFDAKSDQIGIMMAKLSKPNTKQDDTRQENTNIQRNNSQTEPHKELPRGYTVTHSPEKSLNHLITNVDLHISDIQKLYDASNNNIIYRQALNNLEQAKAELQKIIKSKELPNEHHKIPDHIHNEIKKAHDLITKALDTVENEKQQNAEKIANREKLSSSKIGR